MTTGADQVSRLTLDLPPGRDRLVAVDTESSGLYVDDYARGSAARCSLAGVSVAWVGEGVEIITRAFPFDQERYSAKQWNGDRPMLFDGEEGGDDPNLGYEEWWELLTWLSGQKLVMQKAKHDLHFLATGTRAWSGMDLSERLEWDTLLASRILEPTKSAALEEIGMRHFGVGKWREELEAVIRGSKGRYGLPTQPRYDLVPWRVIKPYMEQDAGLTLRVYLWQQEEFGRRGNADGQWQEWGWFQEEMELAPILFHMERVGVEYDREEAYRAAMEIERRMEKLAVDLEFDPTPEKAAAWFFDQMGAVPHCVTEKKGRPSVKECCVRSLTGQPKVAEQARVYAKWVKLDSANVKYYVGWTNHLGLDGRLRTDFDQTGTVSGRFSSKRVNLQSAPHEYKHVDHVEGLVLPRQLLFPTDNAWEFDLGQAELRMATSYAGCKLMREFLEDGADAHAETAKMLFGEVTKEQRQVAKRANFALIFNVGPRTFMLDLEQQIGLKITEEQSREIIDRWRGLYPEFPAINARATRLVERRGYVQLWDGRKRWFSDRELRFHSSKAFNQVIQGGIALVAKAWMREVEREFPGVLRLQIHDSLVCVLPVEQERGMAATIAAIGQRIATQAAGIEMIVEEKRWK